MKVINITPKPIKRSIERMTMRLLSSNWILEDFLTPVITKEALAYTFMHKERGGVGQAIARV